MKLQTIHEARTASAPSRDTILNRVLGILQDINPSATQETVVKLAAVIEAEMGFSEETWYLIYNGVKPLKNDIKAVERTYQELLQDTEDTEGNIDYETFEEEIESFYHNAPFKK